MRVPHGCHNVQYGALKVPYWCHGGSTSGAMGRTTAAIRVPLAAMTYGANTETYDEGAMHIAPLRVWSTGQEFGTTCGTFYRNSVLFTGTPCKPCKVNVDLYSALS